MNDVRAALPHQFADPQLLDLALSHASLGRTRNNERLEFLGDAVLDLVVAEDLFTHLETEREGSLTERKAAVVSRAALAEAARDLALGEMAHFGPGLRSQALPRSVLANLYEAVLGAVYLDAGLEAARRFALETLADQLERVRREEDPPDNPKQELQRWSQLETGDPPIYNLLQSKGTAHARAFLVEAEVAGQHFPSAWGRTRKEAERWAAHEALLVIAMMPD